MSKIDTVFLFSAWFKLHITHDDLNDMHLVRNISKKCDERNINIRIHVSSVVSILTGGGSVQISKNHKFGRGSIIRSGDKDKSAMSRIGRTRT